MIAALVLAGQVVSWPAGTVSLTTAEVTRLLGPAFGVEHCVRAADNSGCNDAAVYLSLVEHRPAEFGRSVVGVANRETGRVAVFTGAVAALLPPPPSASRLALAVGRVAAHEVAHALSGRRGHWGSGLMRSCGDGSYLVARTVAPLTADEVRAQVADGH